MHTKLYDVYFPSVLTSRVSDVNFENLSMSTLSLLPLLPTGPQLILFLCSQKILMPAKSFLCLLLLMRLLLLLSNTSFAHSVAHLSLQAVMAAWKFTFCI